MKGFCIHDGKKAELVVCKTKKEAIEKLGITMYELNNFGVIYEQQVDNTKIAWDNPGVVFTRPLYINGSINYGEWTRK
jgi:hypothetical protein